MKDRCNTCFKNIEKGVGCYSTPSGLFCVLCYEGMEILKYERFARHAIHSLLGEKNQLKSTVDFNCTKTIF